MMQLLDVVRRHADACADAGGIAATPIRGLSTVRANRPGELVHAISKPLICLVQQGSKSVTMGTRAFGFGAGDSLLITADVPTVSQVTRASAATPYYSLVLELDRVVIAEVATQMKAVLVADHAPIRVEQTDMEVADVALRLMRLLDRPASAPVLQAQLVREMHHWLLAGRHGAAIRRLGWPDDHAERIGRAVALLRADFAKPVRVERLAAEANMSPSTFHQHFRAVTSLSPLQFQKHLRLIEARRLMLTDGTNATTVAYAVGYESVSQFTREFCRLFGSPPLRHAQDARRAGHGARMSERRQQPLAGRSDAPAVAWQGSVAQAGVD